MDFQTDICKPAGKKKGNNDLGNKSDHPQDQGISSIFKHIRFQKADIILQAYEIRPHFFDS